MELSRKYNISPVMISRWKKEYYSGKFFENKSTDYARFEIKIKELERMVGRLTMENDTLKEIIELVESQKKQMPQVFTSKDWEALKRGCRQSNNICCSIRKHDKLKPQSGKIS